LTICKQYLDGVVLLNMQNRVVDLTWRRSVWPLEAASQPWVTDLLKNRIASDRYNLLQVETRQAQYQYYTADAGKEGCYADGRLDTY
jgi:hypothetical protein